MFTLACQVNSECLKGLPGLRRITRKISKDLRLDVVEFISEVLHVQAWPCHACHRVHGLLQVNPMKPRDDGSEFPSYCR